MNESYSGVLKRCHENELISESDEKKRTGDNNIVRREESNQR